MILKEIELFLKKLIIFFLNIWKLLFSPLLGKHCRYSPSCSEYAKQCLEKYNIFKAILLIIKRILKCNSLFAGGNDPA